ncbi:MAG: glycosyltransferase [Cyanobacteria bacterium J06581_3]
MNTMLLSIIIPTYHRDDLLAKCLDCLKPEVQTLTDKQYEVVVSDDGGHKTAEQMVQDQYPWVTWVAGPQKGPAANRNNGAKYAQGKWLVFTDDDCLPDPQWLEAYVEAIREKTDCLVFEGRVYVDRPKRSLAEKSPRNETGGYLWSCNLAIQRDLFKSLQGFDERFPYAAMEDVDLRLRLTKSGHPFLFVETAAICHPWRISRGWRELRKKKKSTLLYLSIHPDQLKHINAQFYAFALVRSFIKVAIPGLIKFRGSGIRAILLEYCSYVQMIFILWLKQCRHQSSLSNDPG